jgi:AraC-like DNA-binding protein
MNALVFDYPLLDLPIIEPNPQLLPLFEKAAGEALAISKSDETYADRVVRVILGELGRDTPSVESTAEKLGISIRSLQLYLKREGVSYSGLLHEIRRDAAINYLKDKNAAISEIAYFLGFSESSAFQRAFKKWTGVSPGEFRTEKSFFRKAGLEN